MKKTRKKRRAPDEQYQYGPFLVSRYGKLTVQQSIWTEEGHKEFKEKMIARFPQIGPEIDATVSEIREIAKKYNPIKLLSYLYWKKLRSLIGLIRESEIGHDQAVLMQLILYLHNVMVSTIPETTQENEIEEAVLEQLIKLYEKLGAQISAEYQLAEAFVKQSQGNYDDEAEKIRGIARQFYNGVSGHQYQVLVPEVLEKLLTPHNDVLNELFGASAKDIVEAILKIQKALTEGLGSAIEELQKFQQESMAEVEKKINVEDMETVSPEEHLQGLMGEVIKENGWQEKINDIMGRAFGADLFDVQKVTGLPTTFLDPLSLSPGEDRTFFDATKPFAGWPLKFYPARFKPFLKIDGKYYCFDQFLLTDNIYRALSRAIRARKPEYKDTWQDKQGKAVEAYAFELFLQLLPNAKTIRNIYYPTSGGMRQLAETDGVVIFDDNLFILEMKADAFNWNSPATDFEGFEKSIQQLIGKPYTQGKRFLEYLRANPNAALYDKDGNQIGNLTLSDFRRIHICCVTMEQLTDLGGRLANLKAIGTDVDVNKYPVWSVSIDDLAVYKDLIRNPLIFCHYLEQRRDALLNLDGLLTFDELDHYGAYIRHNNYAMSFEEKPKDATLQFHGYNATYNNYEALHAQMEAVGFSRTITSDDGRTFQLPPAEYNYVGPETEQQVLGVAKQAAARTGLNWGILVTAGQSRVWEGLPLVTAPNMVR